MVRPKILGEGWTLLRREKKDYLNIDLSHPERGGLKRECLHKKFSHRYIKIFQHIR